MKEKTLKIALVHDYLRDFGGAERVLFVLSEMYPEAPIHTAFFSKNSPAYEVFKGKIIKESPLAPLIKTWRLYSPLRFLLPLIWGSIDLSSYDLVITSTSNYIARGFKTGENTIVIAYCHTPPRFLYGLKTGFDWKKHILVRIYGHIVAHFLRMYDFETAQNINHWVANSNNVAQRIEKFYRKSSVVIYPPVNVNEIIKVSKNTKSQNYFLIVARLVGSKGIEEAVLAANKLKISLKIVGEAEGFTSVRDHLKSIGEKNVEFLGRVPDDKLWKLYGEAKGFIALARDEDFGMTVVEAQAAGTPVIAFNGGGFKESVVEGETGILINDTDEETIRKALVRFNKIKWNKKVIQNNAKRFSQEVFEQKIQSFVKESMLKYAHARTPRG